MKNKLVVMAVTIAGFASMAAVPSAAMASGSSSYTSAPTVVTAAASGLTTSTPAVAIKVVDSTSLAKVVGFTVVLPKGVTFNTEALMSGKVTAAEKFATAKASSLTVTLKTGVSTLSVSFKKGTLTLSKSLKAEIAKKKIKVLKFVVDLKNSKGKIKQLTVSVKV